MDVYCRLEEGDLDPDSMLPIYRHRSLIAPSVTLDSYKMTWLWLESTTWPFTHYVTPPTSPSGHGLTTGPTSRFRRTNKGVFTRFLTHPIDLLSAQITNNCFNFKVCHFRHYSCYVQPFLYVSFTRLETYQVDFCI
jgi:hypothetical protein